MARLRLSINDAIYEADARDNWTLNDVLRNVLDLTGTKRSCDYGGCGACTVLMDGLPIYSCVTLATNAEGHRIQTIEGVQQQGELRPIQRAFADRYAAQCGWCTPAMIMASTALLAENTNPSEDEIRDALSGVLCRCTGYGKIILAVEEAAREMRAAAEKGGRP
jgi:carbon-monoxide dehydrogenase small subunit